MNYIHDVALSETQVKDILTQCDENFSLPRWPEEKLMKYFAKLSQFACKDLVTENGKVIGCNMYYVNNDTHIVFISIIAVNKQYRGHSIGSLLISQMKEKFDKPYTIRLQVRSENYMAQQFYKKQGFTETETLDTYITMSLSM